ncbi:MAG: response regulator [Alphaproteobacteria bacterium]|nr:response regulator [Alphaproteobacteria bacterium]
MANFSIETGRPGPMARVNPIGVFGSSSLVVGFLVLLSMLAIFYFVENESEKSEEWVTHTRQVQTAIVGFLSTMQDLETGQRGFLLTGQVGYLAPFRTAVQNVNSALENLRTLTADNPRQQLRISNLSPLIDEKVDELETTIDLYQSEGLEAALELVTTNVGKEIMDQIRMIVQELAAEEETLLIDRETQSSQLRTYSVVAFTIALFLLIGISLIIFLRLRHFVAYREQTEKSLLVAKEEAETANNAKSEFLSSMSHELRTPLNAIIGFGQILNDPGISYSEIQREGVGHILESGHHLLDLINDVLELAKIESGNLEISIEAVSIDALISPAMGMAKALGKQYGIKVEASEPETLTDGVLADLTRARQVLLNLLSNAVKYNRPGGSVDLSCTSVEGGQIRFSVSDTGQGIPEENFDALFKPFDRLDKASSPVEGTGIGLTISKQLVEQMGGRMGVESTLGKGSLFWFEIPAAPFTTPESGAIKEDYVSAAEIFSVAPGIEASHKRVFYIEDNPANIQLMKAIMAEAPNFELEVAKTAEMGLASIRKSPPDIVLMDINLPGMSGSEATRLLKQDPLTKDIPVIAISANALEVDTSAAKNDGFDRYITKPFKVPDVWRAIAEVTDRVAGYSAVEAAPPDRDGLKGGG